MLILDGSIGEGGGQILRSALALSLVTGEPFQILRIRAGRERPGLLRQHLTAVEAACAVGGVVAEGAERGSQALTFRPGPVRPGNYSFSIGSAGSATLVVQTILPALLTASGPSTLTVLGGTHNPAAPPFEFLEQTFLPIVNRMGPRVVAVLHRPGFYPAGGGRVTVRVEPAARLAPLDLVERGDLEKLRVEAVVAGLPRRIAEREVDAAGEELGIPREARAVRELSGSLGPGNVVSVFARFEQTTEVFTGFGRKGVPAEAVAHEAAAEAHRYLEAGTAVGEHLADQLVLPLALAGAGRFTTLPLTRHATTNIGLIERFLPVHVEARPVEKGGLLIEVH